MLKAHRWPGNVRELQNVAIYCATMATGPVVQREDLPPALLGISPLVAATGLSTGLTPAARVPAPAPAEPMQLDDLEKQTILRVLEQTGGHRERAARLLGISSRTLSRKLKSYNLQLESVEI